MEKIKAFLKRKNIIISAKRYGIDALGAMAQGLFASLLIGTIFNTLGDKLNISLNFMGKIEVAFSKPSLDTLIEIADKLDISVSELVKYPN